MRSTDVREASRKGVMSDFFVGAFGMFGTTYANMLRLPLGSSRSTVLNWCVGTSMRRALAPVVLRASGGSGLPWASR